MELIFHEYGGTQAPRPRVADRKKIRSQAMRHFRRIQKHARNDEGPVNPQPRNIRPATDDRHALNRGNTSELMSLSRRKLHNCSGEVEVVNQQRPQDPEACESRIVSQPGGSPFYRYMLAELFGASLIGSSPQRIRSPAISAFRRYVAVAQSDVLDALDDTLCLLLPACTLNDPDIMHEARKRHLAGVWHMRAALEGHVTNIDAVIAAAVELNFLDCFRPVSVGGTSLYGGVVHLARTHIQHLETSQAPVTGFLLIQLRQIMLLESLASRTCMPIGVGTWDRVQHTFPLLPEMTEALMQLAIQLPDPLIAARDAAARVSQGHCATDISVTEMLVLQGSLMRWQAKYCTQLTTAVTALPFTRKRQEDPIRNSGSISDLIRLAPRKPLLSIYCQIMCYICLLLLQEALASLAAARDELALTQYYTSGATRAADTLCRLAAHLLQETDGLLNKAVSVCAPLHFARQWYVTSGDLQGAAWARQQEIRIQTDIPFLSWPSLLRISLVSLYMQE